MLFKWSTKLNLNSSSVSIIKFRKILRFPHGKRNMDLTKSPRMHHAWRCLVHVTKSMSEEASFVNKHCILKRKSSSPWGCLIQNRTCLPHCLSQVEKRGWTGEKIRSMAHVPHFNCANNTKLNFAAKCWLLNRSGFQSLHFGIAYYNAHATRANLQGTFNSRKSRQK